MLFLHRKSWKACVKSRQKVTVPVQQLTVITIVLFLISPWRFLCGVVEKELHADSNVSFHWRVNLSSLYLVRPFYVLNSLLLIPFSSTPQPWSGERKRHHISTGTCLFFVKRQNDNVSTKSSFKKEMHNGFTLLQLLFFCTHNLQHSRLEANQHKKKVIWCGLLCEQESKTFASLNSFHPQIDCLQRSSSSTVQMISLRWKSWKSTSQEFSKKKKYSATSQTTSIKCFIQKRNAKWFALLQILQVK